MNISSVPQSTSSEGAKKETCSAETGSKMAQGSLLFALFLQNCIASTDTEGQTTDGELTDSTLTDGDITNLSSDAGLSDSIIGQNAFQQILQNLFPAGMEANSGSIGDQNSTLLSSLATNLTLGSSGIDMASLAEALENFASTGTNGQTGKSLTNGEGLKLGNYLKAFGIQGIANSKADSLDPAELDKYNTTLNYLKELSGTITAETGVKSGSLNDPAAAIKLLQIIAGKDSAGNKEITGLQENTTAVDTAATGNISGVTTINQSTSQQTDSGDAQQSSTKDNTTDGIQAVLSGNNTGSITDTGDDPILDTDTLSSGKVWDQVLSTLKKHDMHSQEISNLSIQLNPQELGKMDISLHMKDGQLHLVINASEQVTGTIIQNSLQELRDGLAQIGVSCGSLELGYQNNQQTPDKSRYSNTESAGFLYQEEEQDILPVFTSYLNSNTMGSRINVSA